MPRGMAERWYRKSIQSFPRRHPTPDTFATHESGLLAHSGKTLARFEARNTAVINVHEET